MLIPQMGCVFGREVSSGVVYESKDENREAENGRRSKNLSVESRETLRVGERKIDNDKGGANSAVTQEEKDDGDQQSQGERRRRSRQNPRLSNLPKHKHGEQVAAGWPSWLSAHVGEAIDGWLPRRADTFEKIDKIGSGTYSNVYKARDNMTGKIVALKKYMEHDLAGLAASPEIKFTEAQVKCYMHQLLSGLEHCHNHDVLHRDIKGSNLLIDNEGILKIADFGLATIVDPSHKHPLTSRVVTLWYRAPELLLGATDYGVGIDLWSAGCILAELLAGKPIMPGRTEVEQLHKIYKLCGSPSDEYWKKSKLPNATLFKPREPYRRCVSHTFKHFPTASLPLIETLLAMIQLTVNQHRNETLQTRFFTTEPYACDPSSLPQYPPTKEIDAKRRDNEARRLKAANKAQGDGTKKTRTRDRAVRAIPAPEANAELQSNVDRQRLISHANAKSKSEKFPPPHQDGALGVPLGASHHIDPAIVPPDIPFTSTSFTHSKEYVQTWSGPLVDPVAVGASRRKKHGAREQTKSFTGKKD
ncbi:hypothetical protein HYC85_010272 [Camellia sinensis]|uniref:Protein kinase domain-containing protein n=1 Tax=Camellia sinensis TaxID=4442 RepID=A0A7J7HK27_CAMSI|nr:hypothetical protein HYC85_010272 [Camellia sinensis]